MKRVLEWQTTVEQQEMLKPLDELKEEYAHKVAEWTTMMPPEHHQFLFWQAQDISYEVSLEFAKRSRLKKWCAQCNKKVSVWTDSYTEDKMKVTTTLCKLCNAILEVQHGELGHEAIQEMLDEDGYVDSQLLGS